MQLILPKYSAGRIFKVSAKVLNRLIIKIKEFLDTGKKNNFLSSIGLRLEGKLIFQNLLFHRNLLL